MSASISLLDAYGRLITEPPNGADLATLADLWNKLEANDHRTICLVMELRLFGLRNPDAREKIAEFEQRTEEVIAEFISLHAAAARTTLSADAAVLAAVLHGGALGLQQHVALCNRDHRDLFSHFLRLVIGDSGG